MKTVFLLSVRSRTVCVYSDIISIVLTGHHSIFTNYQVKTSKSLKVIPTGYNRSRVTKLVFEGSLITLKESDRLALASYPMLEELSLDDNLVTEIPAKYFAVMPKLRVLSLSRNKISR